MTYTRERVAVIAKKGLDFLNKIATLPKIDDFETKAVGVVLHLSREELVERNGSVWWRSTTNGSEDYKGTWRSWVNDQKEDLKKAGGIWRSSDAEIKILDYVEENFSRARDRYLLVVEVSKPPCKCCKAALSKFASTYKWIVYVTCSHAETVNIFGADK